MDTLETRGELSLQVIQPGEIISPFETINGFRKGAISIYAPGALGMAMAHNLGTDQFITRAESKSGGVFSAETDIRIATNEIPDKTESVLHARFSRGIVETYRSGNLTEIIVACPNADKVPDLINELVNLTYEMATDGLIKTDFEGNLYGLENLPNIVLASNGILDESLRERVGEEIIQVTRDKRIGEILARGWLNKIVRGLSYVSAERTGFGSSAIYKLPSSGVVTLTGGNEDTRKRIVELTQGGNIRFLDRGENTVEQEWRKSYTNLMTNIVGLALSYDRRKNIPRLNIPVGRILQRMKPADGVTYVEVEGARELCEHLGKAFFTVAKNKGLFADYETWEDFNKRVFLDPIKDPQGFYRHTPSSLQMVLNNLKTGRLPDGIPPNENQIISTLLLEISRQGDQKSTEVQDALLTTGKIIEENIAAIKETYRKPQIGEPRTGTIRRIFNQTGEVGYIAFRPEDIGLSSEQIQRYTTKSADIDCGEESAIPMTSEVFTYGPEQIPGNVAFITNGAGFTLEAMDRCTEAGVRLGFVSDLRLQFDEGKYYLAMRMALAANPNIDTIAIDVLTTLGTSVDVARAVERIAGENPRIRFVVKVEGRNQEEGLETLERLKQQGISILYTHSDGALQGDKIKPLSLDQLVRDLRILDGMEADETYIKYEQLGNEQLFAILKFALAQRYRNILIPASISEDNAEEIDTLRQKGILHPDAMFGKEFRPVREKEALTGKPVVVIAGYGETPRLQARLMRQAGTEVVLLHPQINEKVQSEELQALHDLGIKTYTNAGELKTDLDRAYSKGVDLIGVCYEPYKPGVENGGFSERVEKAVDSLIALKTTLGLSVVSILIPSEMVPTVGAKNILRKCKDANIWFIGPNSPGMSRVVKSVFNQEGGSHLKVAQIPRQCLIGGDIAVAGVGGTMLFETLSELKKEGRGITWAISLGGDRTRGLSARDAVLIAESDPETKYFVYIGEPGGFAAQELAEVMAAGLITKPVIVKLIGHRQPDRSFVGHAGAVVLGDDYERVNVKKEVLRQTGAIIVETPAQMVQVVQYIEMHPKFGQIDILSNGLKSAQTVMANLVNAENAVIEGLLAEN